MFRLVYWQVVTDVSSICTILLTRISLAFKQQCSVLYAADGVADLVSKRDAALTMSDYDRAIELYLAAIDLDFATATVFANRSKARSNKMLWDDVFLDAQKV